MLSFEVDHEMTVISICPIVLFFFVFALVHKYGESKWLS